MPVEIRIRRLWFFFSNASLTDVPLFSIHRSLRTPANKSTDLGRLLSGQLVIQPAIADAGVDASEGKQSVMTYLNIRQILRRCGQRVARIR